MSGSRRSSTALGTQKGRHRRQLVFSERILRAAPVRSAVTVIAVVVAGLTMPVLTASAETTTASTASPVSYLVTFVAGTSADEQASVLADAGATDVDAIPQLRMHAVTLPGDTASAIADSLRTQTSVTNVNLDRTRAAEGTPDDPSYSDQWALPKIGWDTARDAVTPSGSATVAVLDTGVDGSHPDLSGQLVAGTSVLDGSDGLTDPNGHGTAMAGIVAADTNNGVGVAGVGYKGVKVMPVTVLSADGTGQDSDIINGVVWAADHGADVILMSFSNPGYSAALQAALDYAWDKGAVLVAATGNDGSSAATFPAGSAGVVGVSATNQSDELASSSNYGTDTFLAAPGVGIVTDAAGGGTTSVTGTSASAAVVAGAAGVLSAADDTASPGVIVGRLARNADSAGTTDQTGNGRVSLSRALGDAATDSVRPAGASPVGDGGPLVGPYRAATNGTIKGIVTDASTGLPIAGANVACLVTTTGCNNPDSVLSAADGSYSLVIQYGGGTATAVVTASKVGYAPVTANVAVANNAGTRNFALTRSNSAPVANKDSYSVAEDGTLTVTAPGVLANDADADSNRLTASTVSNPSHGSVALRADGSFTYIPTANYNGSDSFTYKANDGTTDSNTATVDITVTAVDDAPVAANDSYTTDEDTALTVAAPGVLGDDSDVDSSALTAVLASGPSHGTLTLGVNGSFTYTPMADYSGSDSFTYRASDGALPSNVASVTITVGAVNDEPIAAADSYTTAEDTPLTVAAPGVLGNDSDAENNTLTAILVSGPSNGSLTLSSTGSFSYSPAANYNGPDSFRYKANDGLDSNTVTVNLTVTEVNDKPKANGDGATVAEDDSSGVLVDVLANDSTGPANESAQQLTITSVGTPAHGTAVVESGKVRYTPDANFNGSDSFTYSVTDDGMTNGAADNKSDSASVAVTVSEVNDAPVAVADSASLAEDGQLVLEQSDLTGNDSRGPATESAQTLTVSAVGSATHGSVTINGAGEVVFTPAADYAGPAQFSYTVTDNGTTNGVADPKSDTATVPVTVTEVNDDPVAVDDLVSVAEDDSAVVAVRGNDRTGPANEATQTLTVTAVGTASHGTVSISGGGATVTYTPDADYNGPDSFSYTVADDGTTHGSADHKWATATVYVTVTEANDKPVGRDDSASVAEDGQVDVDVLGNDSAGPADEHGQTLSVRDVSTPGHGSASVVAGKVRYVPVANFNGSDSFTYVVCDDGSTNGGSDPQCQTGTTTVTVGITEVNDAPTAILDSTSVAEDEFVDVEVRANDITGPVNESGQTLSVTEVTQPTHGTAVVRPDGSVRYTPDADYHGDDAFSYTISDNGQTNGSPDPLTSTAAVSVTVTAVNDRPVGRDDSAAVAEDGQVDVDVLGNDSAGPADEQGQTLTITDVSAPAHGSATLVTGKVRYLPAANFYGPDSFTYVVCDDGTSNGQPDGKCQTGTATVTVGVTEVNDKPTAHDDTLPVAEDDSATAVDVLGNDGKGPANESGQTLTVTAVGMASHGTVTLVAGVVTYEPAADYNGSDSFTYTITDDGTTNGAADPKTDTATVDVTVTEVNDKPVARGDSASVAEDDGSGVLVEVRANDSAGPANESDQQLTITSVGTPAHGTAVVESGKIRYTPTEADYNGPDSFIYTVTDDGITNGSPEHKSDTATVTVGVTEVNDVPVVTAGPDTTVSEGSTVTVTPNWSDVDGMAPYSVTVNWGDGSTPTTQSVSGLTGSFPHVYADNQLGEAPYTVTVMVTDSGTTNGAPAPKTGTGSLKVTVRNVAPVVSAPGATVNSGNGLTTLTASFTDVGVPDMFPSGSFTVVTNTTSTLVPGTITRNPSGGGTMTATTRLPVGCYTLEVTASVTDDDGGTGTSAASSFASTDVYSASFKDPIKDNERNIAKYGNVVPIKVQVNSSCSGQLVTSPSLFITYVSGIQTDGTPDTTPVLLAESVSSADTGNQMRTSGGIYIYNFATKPLTQGQDYTIRIREGSSTGPVLLRAIFQPKK